MLKIFIFISLFLFVSCVNTTETDKNNEELKLLKQRALSDREAEHTADSIVNAIIILNNN